MRKNKVRNKRNYRTRLLVGFASIAVLIVLLKLIAEPFIERKVAGLLSKYSVTAEEIRLRWILPGVSLQGITLKGKADTTRNSYRGEIQTVDIRRFNIMKVILRKGIQIRNVEIAGGRLEIVNDSRVIPGDPLVFEKDLSLSKVNIQNIEIIFIDKATLQTFHSKGLNTRIGLDFSSKDTFAISGFKVFDMNLEITRWYAADSLYVYSAGGLSYSDITGTATVDSISIIPRYQNEAFTNLFEYQTDRIEGIARKIKITDLSVNDLIRKGDLSATHITVESFLLNSFRDKRKKFEHKQRKMLQQLIYNFPGMLRIDSLRLKNGMIVYAERTENADIAGYVQFNKIIASAANVTNDTMFRKREGYFTISASGMMMNNVPINVDYVARLFDNNHTFSLKGQVGEFDLKALNPYYANNESITLSGLAHTTNFEFTANNYEAIGSLIFLYEDLAIEVNDKGYIRDKITTWFANYQLINSNPVPGKEIRKGKIDYKRDPERFLFNYSVKALMTGIRSTVTDD